MIRFLLLLFAIVCVSPALATELPKQATCHFVVQIDGKQTVDPLNANTNDPGISSWDETDTPGAKDCGQTQWPPMRPAHCYGFAEFDGKAGSTTGYCVEADQDGDKIIWKQEATGVYASELSGTSRILMASGKYAGLSGASKWHCTFGGTFAHYTARCDTEEALKFPAKD